MAFIDGPFDYDDEYFDPHTTADELPAVLAPSTQPVSLPAKTAYTTVRVQFSAPATPGSTVATGYEMSCALEDYLKERFTEWLGTNMTLEIFVQVDVR